jgi:hypothetical protein
MFVSEPIAPVESPTGVSYPRWPIALAVAVGIAMTVALVTLAVTHGPSPTQPAQPASPSVASSSSYPVPQHGYVRDPITHALLRVDPPNLTGTFRDPGTHALLPTVAP